MFDSICYQKISFSKNVCGDAGTASSSSPSLASPRSSSSLSSSRPNFLNCRGNQPCKDWPPFLVGTMRYRFNMIQLGETKPTIPTCSVLYHLGWGHRWKTSFLAFRHRCELGWITHSKPLLTRYSRILANSGKYRSTKARPSSLETKHHHPRPKGPAHECI